MNIEKIKWEQKSYEEFLDYLKSLSDIEYKKFSNNIVNTKLEIIGVRVPILRKIAKNILKTDVEEFFKCVGNHYYEEVFIEGIVLSCCNEGILDKNLIKFIEKIDNWAIVDSFCSNLKVVNKRMDKYWIYFVDLINLNKEFQSRVSIVIMMNYYLIDDYIDRVLKIISSIQSEYYYINMAISWLLSVAVIKYPDKVIELLKSKSLSKFVQNKTISKIQDSYRIDKELKEYVKIFKIK